MYDDPRTILPFNPRHCHHNQNPNSNKWGSYEKYPKISPEDESSTNINWCSTPYQESMENDHSGAESPRLWKNSPSPSHPLLSSRHEAIVRGQWELMEMVKKMPESSYELSLKDMVEHHIDQSPSEAVESNVMHQRAAVKVNRDDLIQNRKIIDKNLSLENKGLFLNMVFPFSFKSKKKNTSVKVWEGFKSEREWWKRKFSGSNDSDSSKTSKNIGGTTTSSGGATATSSGSSDSGGRKKKGWLSSCWPFLHSRSNKYAK